MLKKITLICLFLTFSMALFAVDTETKISFGDTAWMLMATAMVALMTPAGLALFYGGLSNSRSVLNTVGMSYIAFCVASVAWVVIGYSLAFGENNIWIGSFDTFLQNINIKDVYGTIPTLLFVAFQGTFAAIAVAIVSGSVVERMKFSTWVMFSFFWVLFVYTPIAHWVWGEGFLSTNGELDFAGGTVIHINAGVSGLVLALLLGKRRTFGEEEEKPSSLKLTVLGSALLWFGWFGFNAGSALGANFTAASALLMTNIAASIGGLTWVIMEWTNNKKPSLLGVSSGAVSGLVAITPACAFVDTSGALLIGAIGGLVGYFAVVKLKSILKYDDTLDAFGIHGLVGIWGALATGIFANPNIDPEATGLLYGNPAQVWTQLLAILAVMFFAIIGTFVVYKVSAFITGGARVDAKLEAEGLDKAYHGESSFNIS